MRKVAFRRSFSLVPAVLLFASLGTSQTRPVTRPAPRPTTEQLGQLDSSEALFTVMAAITAGGYNQDADSPTNHPLRKAVRDHFAAQTLPSVDALRRYVRDHKSKNGTPELNQYISYALLVTGPPNFGW